MNNIIMDNIYEIDINGEFVGYCRVSDVIFHSDHVAITIYPSAMDAVMKAARFTVRVSNGTQIDLWLR